MMLLHLLLTGALALQPNGDTSSPHGPTPGPWPVLIRARYDIPVPARATALVVERLVPRSSRVSEGDLLMRLDSALVDLHTQRAKAALERALAELQWTEAELKRERALAQGGSGSVSNLERLEAEAKIRGAAVQTAQAAGGIAARDHRRPEVRAPRAGLIVEIYPEVGAMVQAGTPVIRLLTDEDVVAETHVSAAELGHFQLGQGFQIEVRPGNRRPVTLTEITPASGAERSFRLWFTPVEASGFPGPGVDAWLIAPESGR